MSVFNFFSTLQSVVLLFILSCIPSIGQSQSAGGGGSLSRPITSSYNDIELGVNHGNLKKSVDLELGDDAGYNGKGQIVGLRFTDIQLPQGVQITKAYIQFTTSEVSVAPTKLYISLSSDLDPAKYFLTDKILYESSSSNNKLVKNPVQKRLRGYWMADGEDNPLRSMDYIRSWSPAGWDKIGARGEQQRWGNLEKTIQIYIDEQSSWQYGDQLIFWIWAEKGSRVASSFEGGAPPVLHIEYKLIE